MLLIVFGLIIFSLYWKKLLMLNRYIRTFFWQKRMLMLFVPLLKWQCEFRLWLALQELNNSKRKGGNHQKKKKGLFWGLKKDIANRSRFYYSDFADGYTVNTILKT